MDVLCSDKTGTLTRGVLELHAAVDASGNASNEVLRDACVNASLETGLANPLDAAIVARADSDRIDTSAYRKLDEIPYDFIRKRLSIVVEEPGGGLALLPLLAKQILLNNFLSDVPGMTIATDNIDPELVAGPRRWDFEVLRRFTFVFGSISSIFDFLTFAVLLTVFQAGPAVFRTGRRPQHARSRGAAQAPEACLIAVRSRYSRREAVRLRDLRAHLR